MSNITLEPNLKQYQYEVLSGLRGNLPSIAEIARLSGRSPSSVQNVLAGTAHTPEIIEVITNILLQENGSLPVGYRELLNRLKP